jgi:hypothetical protein
MIEIVDSVNNREERGRLVRARADGTSALPALTSFFEQQQWSRRNDIAS